MGKSVIRTFNRISTLTSKRELARGVRRIAEDGEVPQDGRDEDDLPFDTLLHHLFSGGLRCVSVRITML